MGTAEQHTYIAIDLKSFYASAECASMGLDPLTTNLVVADLSRTEKTICLAVSPSLKSYGISGRARLFEVVEAVKRINVERKKRNGGQLGEGSSDNTVVLSDPSVALDYIVAPPRMAYYIDVSTKIYDIYLQYVAHEDMHVYSVDEVFMDVTAYLRTYHMTAHELARKMIGDVLAQTGITATAGIGTNMYLCKIAMDVYAKHTPADKDGVRIAELDEMSYRRELWNHTPLTDFWRVGHGIASRLAEVGIYTMGDIARCSLGSKQDFLNEDLLYKMFGINAELLIDHAWGWEPCTIADVKAYKPVSNSLSSGQVLTEPYTFEKARIVVHEMTDGLVLDLVRKGLVTDQMVLTVGYDITSLTDPEIRSKYRGEVTLDWYGKPVPKQAHGSINLSGMTSSSQEIIEKMLELFDRIVNPVLLIRRMYVVANHIMPEAEIRAQEAESFTQMNLFDLMAAGADSGQAEKETADEQLQKDRGGFEKHRRRTPSDAGDSEDHRTKERRLQEAILDVKDRYGKNALMKGMNLQEGATAMERNRQIGGHKA